MPVISIAQTLIRILIKITVPHTSVPKSSHKSTQNDNQESYRDNNIISFIYGYQVYTLLFTKYVTFYGINYYNNKFITKV